MKLTITIEFSEQLTEEEKEDLEATIQAQCEEDEEGFGYGMTDFNAEWKD